jgi:hypothetical protein
VDAPDHGRDLRRQLGFPGSGDGGDLMPTAGEFADQGAADVTGSEDDDLHAGCSCLIELLLVRAAATMAERRLRSAIVRTLLRYSLT